MARLNRIRQNKLEPLRMEYAKKQIESKGYKVRTFDDNLLCFDFKDHTVKFYPYSGWATGHTIKDGRGLKNLLNQI